MGFEAAETILGSQLIAPVTIYAIFCEGRYLVKVGWKQRLVWTYSLDEANLYVSEKAMKKDLNTVARSQAKMYGGPGAWPEVHEFTMTFVRKIDNTDYFKKNRDRAAKAEATRQANWDKVREREQAKLVERLREQLKCEEELLRTGRV